MLVGRGVLVGLCVGVGCGVLEGRGMLVGLGVLEGNGMLVGLGVLLGWGVVTIVAVGVAIGPEVIEGVGEGVLEVTGGGTGRVVVADGIALPEARMTGANSLDGIAALESMARHDKAIAVMITAAKNRFI